MTLLTALEILCKGANVETMFGSNRRLVFPEFRKNLIAQFFR